MLKASLGAFAGSWKSLAGSVLVWRVTNWDLG